MAYARPWVIRKMKGPGREHGGEGAKSNLVWVRGKKKGVRTIQNTVGLANTRGNRWEEGETGGTKL